MQYCHPIITARQRQREIGQVRDTERKGQVQGQAGRQDTVGPVRVG